MSVLLLLLLSAPAPAAAADLSGPSSSEPVPEPESSLPPLALPVESPQSNARPPTPDMTAGDLQALRSYRDQRLVLRSETEWSSGGATVYRFGHYRHHPIGLWGGHSVVVAKPVEAHQTWGVYEGAVRLTVPQFLTEAGEMARAQDLQSEITSAQIWSRIWLGGAVLGLTGVVAGLVGMETAPDADTYYRYNQIALWGTGTTVIGMVGASFPSSRASRLLRVPADTLSFQEARALSEAHNDRLREELGISPRQAWQVEQEAAAP